ncbi:phosphoenolpyruvate--protein phosphotransferase [Natronosporangium hydrolyticum]|uniref:Phosphocarrier protein HPr n=1 Tax=Natronosporangium hydrolyticum TaxID=2811111 RepID=A0A895Y7Q8_9ACTN|nr:phosphoenolpyruvate--protein phosphotransferase [Natronosporangium hydrolyticum]QSB13391.1 phosphoenolpyruvate--protein phosphotransferase [Natronosporangium hydrolyticum]
MVGIVVVAHSYPLAQAAVGLAREMAPGDEVAIAVAAGLDETTLGTDATQIQAAIESVAGPAGVLVLMDLGSAVLSAELALELLDPEVREQVLLCPAPLVEGLVVAVVAAAGGAALAEVAAEATGALAGKQEHLAGPAPAAGEQRAEEPAVVETFTVTNPHGLHARPAARLVAELRDVAAQVTLRNLTTGAGPVPANSLSRVSTLGALPDHEVEVAASGPEAPTAVERVLALAARGFDDPAPPAPPAGATEPVAEPAAAGPSAAEPAAAEPLTAGSGGPLPASPGIGIGPIWTPEPPPLTLPDRPAGDPASEADRLREAVGQVRRETQEVRDRTARELGEQDAAIFDAHVALLDDAELLDQVREQIEAGAPVERAWAEVLGGLAEQFAALPDPYQRARAADVQAVTEQVLRALLGVASGFVSHDGVLVAADLTPGEVSQLDADLVAGIVLAHGSPTAHSAILARSRRIPMLVAVGAGVLDLPVRTVVALDGQRGELVVDPDPATRERFAGRAREWAEREATARAAAGAPANTRDGVTIEVAANLGTVTDAAEAAAAGADAAGLVRTEFLFVNRAEPPSVSEQERAYRELAEGLGHRPLTLRTLDVGGDKPVPFLPTGQEANPFLGLRGIRLSLARPEILRDQLVAACRVAHDSPVRLMFPMVATRDEVTAALALLDEAITVVGAGRPAGLEVGIMVEVPAAALRVAAFAPLVDFVSIGTNDLTQYTLAAERGNPSVAALADPLDPAVLRLIDEVCRAAPSSVRVAVCGELAADEVAVPVLVGLGVRELSVVPAAVPMVKQAVRQVDLAAAVPLAARAVTLPSAAEVRTLLAGD